MGLLTRRVCEARAGHAGHETCRKSCPRWPDWSGLGGKVRVLGSRRRAFNQPPSRPLTPDIEPQEGDLNLLGLVMVAIFIAFTLLAVFWLVQGSFSTWLIQPEPP